MKKKYVVIGAGNGGQSLAGDLVLRGTNVTAIYDKNPGQVTPISDNGGIRMSGPVVEGFAPVFATDDLKTAVDSGNVFLVTITANYHRALAKEMAPFIRPEHTVLLIPGYIGSSISFANELRAAGISELPLIGEALSLPYATRLISPAHAGIKSRKYAVPIAAYPSSRNQELYDIVNPAVPETKLYANTLEIGFNNPNPMTHTVYYLFNLGRVESPESQTSNFHAWGTPIVDRIRDTVDEERVALVKAMGLNVLTYQGFRQLSYAGHKYVPLKQENATLPASSSQTPARFIDEDVPMGLVAYQSFGKLLGVPTPTIDVIISMANLVRQKDFVQEGTTVETLGLGGLTAEEILARV